MFHLEIIALFASAFILSCHGTPQGAPKSSCSSLTPVHGAFTVQKSNAAYSVQASRNGNTIRVKINSPVGEEFLGFALQARSNKDKNQMIDGKFTVVSGETKTIDCFSGTQNTLTHSNTVQKREVVTDWTPSAGVNEDIIFRATVAKTYSMFWTKIDSSPIRVDSGSAGSAKQTDESSSDRMYHNCFVNKGCFGLPSGCTSRRDCEVFLSYSAAGNGIAFRMTGTLDSQTYMAMGLSTDQKMGDDLVHECFRVGSNVVLRESWNNGQSNGRNREIPRDIYSGDFTNGLTTCSWTANYLTQSNGRRFNLENSTYFLLLAKGPVRDSNRLGYHESRIASQEAVNFTAFEEIESEGVSDAIKIHGTFMITAWVGLVSFAILLARHFKASWDSHTLCGVKIWFALHRGLMFVALVFVAVAFIVIFVHKDGWNYQTKNPHAVLGCIATSLGLFQPIMAAFRPGPDNPKRPIFNWLHWSVGNAAQIIAVLTIFFAVSLEASGLKDDFYWVMAIFVVIHVFFHFLFQVHTWTAGKKKSNEVKMLDMSAGRGNNIQNNASEKIEKSLADSVFRILLLGIYAIFLVAIILALYVLIGKA